MARLFKSIVQGCAVLHRGNSVIMTVINVTMDESGAVIFDHRGPQHTG